MVKVSKTKQSKIVKYKLEEDCINLRKLGLSCQQIADELNASGKLPDGELIDNSVVSRFLDNVPQVTREIIADNKQRMLQVVNNHFDVYEEINSLFGKTKFLLDTMEEEAADRGRHMDAYRFKAVASEMREMLKLMSEIQKEINDYNNVRKFMEIVLTTLQEECPDKIPVIAEKLRVSKNTQWFANIMRGKDND